MTDSTTPSSTKRWLESPDDIPVYSGELFRRRHWLEPVSTRFQPDDEDLTEEELYYKYRDR
jgi:hypothetical protein